MIKINGVKFSTSKKEDGSVALIYRGKEVANLSVGEVDGYFHLGFVTAEGCETLWGTDAVSTFFK